MDLCMNTDHHHDHHHGHHHHFWSDTKILLWLGCKSWKLYARKKAECLHFPLLLLSLKVTFLRAVFSKPQLNLCAIRHNSIQFKSERKVGRPSGSESRLLTAAYWSDIMRLNLDRNSSSVVLNRMIVATMCF